METIKDIVREMRERFKPYARSESNDARYTAYMGYAEFADRIEAAHMREIADALDTGAFVEAARWRETVTDCNHLNEILNEANGIAESVTSEYIEKKARRICDLCKRITLQGNGAKMREAIDKCVNLITEFGNAEIVKTPLDVIIDIEVILKSALRSAPARNCDKCDSADDAVLLAIDAGIVDFKFNAWGMAEFLLAEAKGECNESK